jgi:hypothetical protein
VSAKFALKRLQQSCSAWEWRCIIVSIQQRLDNLLHKFKIYGRRLQGGSGPSSLKDALQLSTGLLSLLSHSQVHGSCDMKRPPLPLSSLFDAVSELMLPGKGTSVLEHANGVAFFRRPFVHLDDSLLKLASKLLVVVGVEAAHSGSVVSLLGHVTRRLNDETSIAMNGYDDEVQDEVQDGDDGDDGLFLHSVLAGNREDRAWWAQTVRGCDSSYAATVSLNHVLYGVVIITTDVFADVQHKVVNPHFIQLCHHMMHMFIEDALWKHDSPNLNEETMPSFSSKPFDLVQSKNISKSYIHIYKVEKWCL